MSCGEEQWVSQQLTSELSGPVVDPEIEGVGGSNMTTEIEA